MSGTTGNLLSPKTLKRPATLAKAQVRLRNANYDEEEDTGSFVKKFQELIDRECSKESFIINAGSPQGCKILEPGDFIAVKGDVWLFSTERSAPNENWIEVLHLPAGPIQPGKPFF